MASVSSVLDPEIRALYDPLDHMAPSNFEEGKRNRANLAPLRQVPPQAGVVKSHINLEKEGIKGVIYTSEKAPKGDGSRAGVLWIHGGGFYGGVPELFQILLERFVLELGVTVFCPQYGLAPEHPYPEGLNDCYAAWKWFASEGCAQYGLDKTRLLVGGSSAGGGMSMSLALKNRDEGGPKIRATIFDIPYFSYAPDHSTQNVKIDKIWSKEAIAWSASVYTPEGTSDPKKYAWAIEHPSFHDLPPSQILVAEHDVLRDAGIAVALRMLKESSNGVELHMWKGSLHGSHGFMPDAGISVLQVDAIASFASRELGVYWNSPRNPKYGKAAAAAV